MFRKSKKSHFISSYIPISMLILMCFFGNEDATIKTWRKSCRPRVRSITSNKGDLLLVDVILEETIELECHFCNEYDDKIPKIWYKYDYPNNTQHVEVDLVKSIAGNKMFVNSKYNLIIHNISYDHRGMYYCQAQGKLDVDSRIKYFVDIIFDNNSLTETGNLSAWNKYSHVFLYPVNERFLNSNEKDFSYIRDKLNIHLEVRSEWQSWSKCEVCGRPLGAGQRNRKALCRIKPSPFNQNESNIINTTNVEELFFLNIFQLSCRSIMFSSLYPAISNVTKIIPNFIEVEKCNGVCNPDADSVNSKWKTKNAHGFKYRKTFVLAENAHLTLICPESTLENTVVWRRNGKILKSEKSVLSDDIKTEPKITIDTFNTLYFIGVTREEEGNYTCQVDNIKMQQIIVFVTSKSKLLTQAFVRYTMYLAIILSLTLTCYCAGLMVVCKKRSSFKRYEELAKDDTFD